MVTSKSFSINIPQLLLVVVVVEINTNMDSPSNYLMIFVFVFAVISTSINAETTTPPLVEESCEKTDHKEICIEALSSSKEDAKDDIKGLVGLSIEAAMSKATATAEHIKRLTEKKNPPTLQQCIIDCSESYDDVLDQLSDALGGLDKLPEAGQEGEDEIVTWLKAAMSDAGTCEDGCRLHQDVNKNILTEKNTETINYCSIALSMAKQLITL